MIQLVFAANLHISGQTNGFGYKNSLPWGHCTEDLQEFKRVTQNTSLIMGANTFISLPGLLPNRPCIVILDKTRELPKTKNGSLPTYIASSLEEALQISKNADELNYSVIGGPSLLREASRIADKVLLTMIHNQSEADTFVDIQSITSGFYVQSYKVVYNIKNPNIKHIINMEFLRGNETSN